MVLIEMSHEDIKDKELIFSYNLTEGNFLVKKRRFKEAIEAYTRALQLTPGHEMCLTQRSKCYLLLGQHDKALKDSEDALADNPTSIRGITQKAEALYAQGEFEYALVCFHRGQRLRPDIEEFKLGIQKASEAVENSIGEKSGLRFCHVGKILKQLQEKQEQEAQAATLRGQKRKQTAAEEFNAKKNYGCKVLLEELAVDKAFLQRLIHHPELTGTCKEDIVKEATEVLEFMQTRQEFWGQQKPLYARRIQKKMAQGKTTFEEEDANLRKRIEDKKQKIQENHEKITKMLMDIDLSLQHGSYEQAIETSEAAEEIIMSFTLTWLPRRQAYLGVVYSAMGDAHLKLGHYRESLRWHNKDYELSKDNPRLLHSRARALDNLGRTHATFRKYQAAIDAWEQCIPLSKSPEKRTWLFHEIGTCYKQLGRYETARFYGTKCVKEARRCEQQQWIMRGLWLLADAESQLDVMETALKHYDQAIDIANKEGYKREAKDIEKAYKATNEAMSKREAEKREAHDQYRPIGVIQEREEAHAAEGGVRFADKTDETDGEAPTEDDQDKKRSEAADQAVDRSCPDITVTGSDGSSTPEIADSFDDSGSYIDWTDEDTLPPEEPSQEAIDAAKAEEAGEEVEEENSSDSDGSTTSTEDDTEAGEEGELSDDEDGSATETEVGSEAGEAAAEADAGATADGAEGGEAEAGEAEGGEVKAEPAEGGETQAGEDEGAKADKAEEGAAAADGDAETDYDTAAETTTAAEDTADTDAEMGTADEGGEAAADGGAEAAEGDGEAAAAGEEAAETEASATGEAGDEAQADDTNTEAPAEEASTEEAPAVDGEAPAEEAPAEEAPAEESPAEEAPAEETPAEEAPAEEAPAEEAPAEEAPAEEAPAEEAPAEEAPAEEAPAEEAPAEEAPAEEAPAEEAPAEEAPAEEAPAEEAPAEEAPAEEAPAEGGTDDPAPE